MGKISRLLELIIRAAANDTASKLGLHLSPTRLRRPKLKGAGTFACVTAEPKQPNLMACSCIDQLVTLFPRAAPLYAGEGHGRPDGKRGTKGDVLESQSSSLEHWNSHRPRPVL